MHSQAVLVNDADVPESLIKVAHSNPDFQPDEQTLSNLRGLTQIFE